MHSARMANILGIFEQFGGTRKMAAALSLPPSTVQQWKKSGNIPAWHQQTVLAKAQELGLSVSVEDIIGRARQEKSEAA